MWPRWKKKTPTSFSYCRIHLKCCVSQDYTRNHHHYPMSSSASCCSFSPQPFFLLSLPGLFGLLAILMLSVCISWRMRVCQKQHLERKDLRLQKIVEVRNAQNLFNSKKKNAQIFVSPWEIATCWLLFFFQVLNHLKVIKFNVWEDTFEQSTKQVR